VEIDRERSLAAQDTRLPVDHIFIVLNSPFMRRAWDSRIFLLSLFEIPKSSV
jgi:hypothetical protein